MNPALQALREQIDAVDRELLTLLNRRAGLALEVGEIKKHEGSPVFRPEREATERRNLGLLLAHRRRVRLGLEPAED